MKATRLRFRGLKGLHRDFILEPITIVVGDNGTGKSAVAEAVRLALVGYNSRLGKQAPANFKLAQGLELDVRMSFENGGENHVALIKQASGSVKMVPDLAVKCPAVMLDPQEYFGLTGPQRVRFLFSRMGKVEFDIDALIAELKEINNRDAIKKKLASTWGEQHKPKIQTQVRELCDQIESLDGDRLDTGEPLTEFFAKIVKKLTEQSTKAAGVAESFSGAIKATVAQAAEEGPPVNLSRVETQLAELRTKLAKLQADIATRNEALGQAQRNREKAASLKEADAKRLTEFEEAKITLVDFKDLSDAIKIEEDRLKELTLKKPAFINLEAIQKALDRAQRSQTVHETNLNQSEESIKRLAIEREEALKSPCCPTCGGRSKSWQDKLEEKFDAQLKALTDQKAINEKLAQEAKAEAKRIEGDRDKAQKSNKSREEYQTKIDELNSSLSSKHSHQQTRKIAEERVKSGAAATVLGFEVESPEQLVLRSTFIQSLIGEETDLKTQITEREGQQRKATAAAADERRKADAIEKCTEAEIKVAVLKAAVAIVGEEQEKVIAKNIGWIMSKAGFLIEKVMGRKLEFRDGDIGYLKQDGSWVSHETFCGTEEALAYAGLSLAFSDGSKWESEDRCRFMIIDELARLSKPRKTVLLQAVEGLIKADLLDNFLGIDTEAGNYADVPGLAMVRLEA